MPLHRGDKSAGFIGLIATAALLFAIAYGIVLLTNAKFAGHEKGAAAPAGTAQH